MELSELKMWRKMIEDKWKYDLFEFLFQNAVHAFLINIPIDRWRERKKKTLPRARVEVRLLLKKVGKKIIESIN